MYLFSGWIAGLFGLDSPTTTTTTTSTTTHSPPTTTQQNFLSIVNPLQSPQQWLTFLAGHMATSTSNQASSGQQTTSTDKPEKARSKNYSNFQLWRLIPSDQNQLNYLREYKESSDSERIHWLKGPAMRYIILYLWLKYLISVYYYFRTDPLYL